MARVLIVGDSERALSLSRRLHRAGHPTRVVTTDAERREEVEASGSECWIGDPNRLGTITSALDSVTIACWLLGDEAVEDLHRGRLEAFLGKAIDSTVRGFVYEARGGAGDQVLRRGAEVARSISERNEIPLRVLDADPRDAHAWAAAASEAVEQLISPA